MLEYAELLPVPTLHAQVVQVNSNWHWVFFRETALRLVSSAGSSAR